MRRGKTYLTSMYSFIHTTFIFYFPKWFFIFIKIDLKIGCYIHDNGCLTNGQVAMSPHERGVNKQTDRQNGWTLQKSAKNEGKC